MRKISHLKIKIAIGSFVLLACFQNCGGGGGFNAAGGNIPSSGSNNPTGNQPATQPSSGGNGISSFQQHTLNALAGHFGGPGYVNGTGAAASFDTPNGITWTNSGDLFVADQRNNVIRKISSSGVVTTLVGNPLNPGFADGNAATATLFRPGPMAADSSSNLYVMMQANQYFMVRKITPAGVVTTLAGHQGPHGSADGTGAAASFWAPQGIAVDTSGNVYVADSSNNTIRKITPAGVVTTLAGTAGTSGSADGTGSAARFNYPYGVAVDSNGNVFVADESNMTIRKITPAGVVTTFAGSAGVDGSADGQGTAARFNDPMCMTIDYNNNLYVCDNGSVDGQFRIRKITPSGLVSTISDTTLINYAIDGTTATATYNWPGGISVDTTGNIYVSDTSSNRIRKISTDLNVTTIAGSSGFQGGDDGVGTGASFRGPWGIAVDANQNAYVADYTNDTIRKITPEGIVSTLAGIERNPGSADGVGTSATFNSPWGVATDTAGNVFVTDRASNTIRKITSDGTVSTLAGSPGVSGSTNGTGASALFNTPNGIATDTNGNVYVTEQGTCAIRKITPAGVVTTFAGILNTCGSADGGLGTATFNSPDGIVFSPTGDAFVADEGNQTIRKISASGIVSTLAGQTGVSGSSDGTGTSAHFNVPRGITMDSNGNLFVTDLGNNTIRKVTPAGVVTTIAGQVGFAGFGQGPLPGALYIPAFIAAYGTNLFVTSGDAVVVIVP